MLKRIGVAGFCLLVFANGAAAQTITGSGTSGTVPMFNGTSSVTNSVITQSNSNVGIGTTNPVAPLHVATNSTGYGNILTTVTPGAYSTGGSTGHGFGLISNTSFANQGAWANVGLFQTSANPNDLTAGTYLSIHGWYQNSGTSLPIALGGGYVGISPSVYIAAGGSTGAGNVGIGTTSPGAKLEINGNVKLTSGSGASMTFADGTAQTTAWTGVLCGGDYAESVDVSGDRTNYSLGDVLVIDPGNVGKFLKSAEVYSTAVMGIYSTRPGMVGRRQMTPKSPEEVPMAMVGIVPAKVSAENGPVRPGDLLVTSSTPGYAMKGTDRTRMLGAVIGKALGSVESGVGVIEVGVTLQ
jgi:hypothetical protein